MKIKVFEPKSVRILAKRYFLVNTSRMAPVSRLDVSDGSWKFENSIFSICRFWIFWHIAEMSIRLQKCPSRFNEKCEKKIFPDPQPKKSQKNPPNQIWSRIRSLSLGWLTEREIWLFAKFRIFALYHLILMDIYIYIYIYIYNRVQLFQVQKHKIH